MNEKLKRALDEADDRHKEAVAIIRTAGDAFDKVAVHMRGALEELKVANATQWAAVDAVLEANRRVRDARRENGDAA